MNEDIYTVRKENIFDDTIQLLSTLYQPNDFVFAGSTYDKKVYPAGQLVQYFLDVKSHALMWDEETLEKELRKIDETLPFIIPNPVCGKKVMSKTGKESYRCDNAISEFKIMMCEFDHMSKGDQWVFWHGIGFPILALIDSGGKSIHAWVKIDGVANLEAWDTLVKESYYPYLTALGIDPACKNPSRLSRLPGIYRAEKGH